MGYYTSFTLSADSRAKEVDDYLNSLDVDTSYNLAQLEAFSEDTWGMNAKWYNFDEDMCTLSAAFPDVLFVLDGEGEETGDIWRAWYQNGKKISEWVLDFKVPSSPDWNKF